MRRISVATCLRPMVTPSSLSRSRSIRLPAKGSSRCNSSTRRITLDHYGRELDLSLSRPLWKDWTGLVKLADYRADDFARDTRKLWVQVEYKGKWVP
jgi:hypothetical protein